MPQTTIEARKILETNFLSPHSTKVLEIHAGRSPGLLCVPLIRSLEALEQAVTKFTVAGQPLI